MPRRLIWSTQARDDLRGIIEYVAGTWSRRTARAVKDDYLRRIGLLKHFPGLGPAWTEHPDIRLLVLSHLHSVAYDATVDGQIRVLRIIDLRRDPEAVDDA